MDTDLSAASSRNDLLLLRILFSNDNYNHSENYFLFSMLKANGGMSSQKVGSEFRGSMSGSAVKVGLLCR